MRHFDTKSICAAGDLIESNTKVWCSTEEILNLAIADEGSHTYHRGSQKNLAANILVDEQIEAPVYTGQELGRLQVTLEGKMLVDLPLVAQSDIAEAGFMSRFVDWIVLFFTKIIS